MTYETRTEHYAAMFGPHYLDMEEDRERAEWQAEQDEIAARDAHQNWQDEVGDRFIPENDVENPDTMLVVAANGHVYWTSPSRDME